MYSSQTGSRNGSHGASESQVQTWHPRPRGAAPARGGVDGRQVSNQGCAGRCGAGPGGCGGAGLGRGGAGHLEDGTKKAKCAEKPKQEEGMGNAERTGPGP